MAFEYNQTSSKLQSSESLRASVSKPASGGTYIPPYKPSGSVFDSSNRIRIFQHFFRTEASHLPVFLRGPRDYLMYRSVMVFSLFGLGVTLYGFGLMATGKMTKKGQS